MKFYPVSLLGLAIALSINFPAHSQEVRIDFGTVFNVISNLVNPPHRAQQEQADAAVAKEKARQAAEIAKVKSEIQASQNADKAAPVVSKWGVDRISCAPGAVIINGITTDTVCIKPNDRISAGYYTYDAARQQLVRTSTNPATSNQTSDSAATRQTEREQGF
jgi:hypothetical protein